MHLRFASQYCGLPAQVELPAAFVELAVYGDQAAQDLDPEIDGAFAYRAVREADLCNGEDVPKQQPEEGSGFEQALAEGGGHGVKVG